MNRRSSRLASYVTAGVLSAALVVAAPGPAVAAGAPSAVPAPAPVAYASVGGEPTLVAFGFSEGELTPDALCTFLTNGDYVHVSSSAFEASGHGWWTNINCSATLAVVTVQLQEFYSDGSWRNKGTVGQATVRSGGGAGNRATGRAACADANLTGWRSVVDVDLVGLIDDPGVLITAPRNISCRVY